MDSAWTWMRDMVPPLSVSSSKTTAATAVSAICAYYGWKTANKSLQDRRRRQRRRLPEYTPLSDDLVRSGILISDWEKEAELPRKVLSGNDADEIFFSGIDNRNKDSITIKLTRLHAKYTEVFMLVTLKHNQTYSTFVLPFNQVPTGQCQTNQKNHWKAGDLNIWCTLPNRSYRICFNGLLRNVESGELQHVSFSMRWTTFSEFLDFYQYATEENERFMNQYEHFGIFRGTYRIEESQDAEMALWGVRNRKFSQPREKGKCVRLYLYTKNGTAIGITYYVTGEPKRSILIGSLMAAKQVIYNVEFDRGTEYSLLELEKTGMTKLKFQTDACKYEMFVCVEKEDSQNGRTKIHPSKCVLNNVSHKWKYSGKGIFESEEISMDDFGSCSCKKILISDEDSQSNKEEAEEETLVGGKAMSLNALMKISRQVGFEVPRASFVTTLTFKYHLDQHPKLNLVINSLNSNQRGQVLKLEEISERIYELMMASTISSETKSLIDSNLRSIFGDKFDSKLFSVRSSAVGEDGEEMSNAGQMDTFLGVKGMDEIIESIKKCWASCYSLRALQYRRQYGQLLTADMGVVIQEMVDAESAGVMFTREPVTGHPSVIMITSNKGLGESVVSGTCQPDTIKLLKNPEDNSLSILEYKIGTKDSQIFLQDDGGTFEKEAMDASEKSISESMALSLGKIGVKIEELMFEPKDIEWAIKEDTIYLLQARPITTLNMETDFDVIHEFDSPLVTDHEVNNAGNIQEVMPNALSPLGRNYTCPRVGMTLIDCFYNMMPHENAQVWGNKFRHTLGISSHGHLFLPRTDNLMLSFDSESHKWNDLTMNGRILDEETSLAHCRERYIGHRNMALSTIPYLIHLYFNVDNIAKQMNELEVPDEDLELNKVKTMEEVYYYLANLIVSKQTAMFHVIFSMGSSMTSVMLIKELLRDTDINKANWTELMSDLAKLLEVCGEESTVESADIPRALQRLVKVISKAIDPEKYISMSEEEALDFISADDSPVKSEYDAFMKRHGHRGVNEFDLGAEVWELFPSHLIKSTQIMMKSLDKMKEKKVYSLEESVKQLKSNITESRKKVLIKLAKSARKHTGYREQAKAKLIKSVHVSRKAFLHLADMMVDAGMLTDQRLIFFFKFDEIEDFLKTRSPRIMQRVMRRKRMDKYLQSLVFPEILTGIMKPLETFTKTYSGEVNLQLKGIPVCHGIITAKVRVCKTLPDACDMQHGEILVARATDVAWSPYFPIASGVITELGGLISHGAVVAREYGLPCVIDVIDATSLLSTGDVVTLNGSTGIVTRVSTAEASQ